MSPAAAATNAPVEAEVGRLKLENKRLADDLGDVTDERDNLQREVNQLEMDLERRVVVSGLQRESLKWARDALESSDPGDAFARTMIDRAIDTLSELVGDR